MPYTLPDVAACKNYVRVLTSTEDALFALWLASAQAMIEAYINRPILARLLTEVDAADTFVAYGVVTTLQTRVWPIAATDLVSDPPVPAPVVTDADGAVVDATTYTVNRDRGLIKALRGYAFDNGPYTLVYTGGVSAFATWDTVQGPIIGQAILDVVSDLYANRTPASQSESENGVSVSWTAKPLSARTMKMLASVSPVPVL